METNRNQDLAFKRGYYALLVLGYIAMSIALSSCKAHSDIVNFLLVRRDKHGKKPQDIAQAFIEAAQEGDYDQAGQYWTKDSMNALNHSPVEGSFEQYCQQFSQFSSYTVSKASPGKSGYYWATVKGIRKDTQVVEWDRLYFKHIDGVWFLTKSSVGSFSHRRAETEPHGVIKIMPPVIESRYDSEGREHKATISIHRIDHSIIRPHIWGPEDDGSVSYRLAPGSHAIEYREMLGELAEQSISFFTKELVVEEGYLHILNGYEVKRQKLTTE